jgi:heme-degrading monooxygenase HmoA
VSVEAKEVVVLSRFRVANGLDAEVRAAFLSRPRLVDDAPGFLGMETFVDQEDEHTFYLLTRWTDFESFHRWHGGASHRESHKFIPKGLKLDPSFTRVWQWRKLSD